ncbi:MAG: YidC/Oxa1 family membrane protein insertase [Lachnospiraceae bacterium]|jgi:YidC/Oxa1 family membrane protein insertase|nr:YidC/Oxa1 family membrane protein insertase [Lachnospiraceae bacterium]
MKIFSLASTAATKSSAASWPIVGQIAILLGIVMNFIYTTLDKLLPSDTGLIGISIIIYTIVVYMILLPLTINQQRTQKLNSVIQPEVQKIQKKYKNKKDQASMMKQQEEIKQVYEKYGTSMTGGCLPLLIQMPFLFGLYPVVMDMARYVPAIKSAPEAVNRFLTIPSLSVTPFEMIKKSGTFGEPAILVIITAIMIPLLAGLSQFLSVKISQNVNDPSAAMPKDNPMAGTMKSMTYTMPILSAVMCFTFATGIGVYWIVSALVRLVQQIFINKHLQQMSVEDLIEKNKEKAARKAAKRKERMSNISEAANTNAKNIKKQPSGKAVIADTSSNEDTIEASRVRLSHAKPGSLASKANLVNSYNTNTRANNEEVKEDNDNSKKKKK